MACIWSLAVICSNARIILMLCIYFLCRIIVVSLSILVILHTSTHIIVYFCEFLILFSLCTSLAFLILLLPLSWNYSVASFLFFLFALYSYTLLLREKTFISEEFHFLSLLLFFKLFLSFLVDIFFLSWLVPDRYVHFTIIL